MIDLAELFKDKSIKPKEKIEQISQLILTGELSPVELIDYAMKAKDPEKASCMEAFEFATRTDKNIASEIILVFAVDGLSAKAPRLKWESAKVIGNAATLFPKKLDKAINGLLINTQDAGTVVRWASAYALGEILKLKTKHQAQILERVKEILGSEEKNSIKKIYQAALKKLK